MDGSMVVFSIEADFQGKLDQMGEVGARAARTFELRNVRID
jgi:hypothetical protein